VVTNQAKRAREECAVLLLQTPKDGREVSCRYIAAYKNAGGNPFKLESKALRVACLEEEIYHALEEYL
jgi:hypothetical protein